MKIKILNHNINIVQGTGFINYPYFDVNYSSSTIIVGSNVPLTGENVDKELLNNIIVKGSVKILNYYFNGLGSQSNVVYEWLLSKVNILKEIKE
jgi:hypothetical protein